MSQAHPEPAASREQSAIASLGRFAGSRDALLSGVAFVGDEDAIAGTGFLLEPELVCTCAHVVSDALGLPRDERDSPADAVAVTLQRSAHVTTGTVEAWFNDGTDDLALLRLADPAPVRAAPVRL